MQRDSDYELFIQNTKNYVQELDQSVLNKIEIGTTKQITRKLTDITSPFKTKRFANHSNVLELAQRN